MEPSPKISVVGTGAVGSSLIKQLSGAGYEIKSVISRHPAREVHNRIGTDLPVIHPDELTGDNIGQVLFISTPDDVISKMDETISELDINWQGRVVTHCSGFHASNILKKLNEKGASVAAFHPIQSFVDRSGKESFKNIYISIEGGDTAVGILLSIALNLHAKPISLNSHQKEILHIAAVFFSNYVVTLGGIADRLIKENIDGADLKVLSPLIRQTINNLEQLEPAKALSGPIARGDIETVEKHLETLKKEDDIEKVYRLLGKQALKLAEQLGEVPEKSIKKMDELFSD